VRDWGSRFGLPLAACLAGLIVPAAAAGAAGSTLAIAYTAELRGNLLPCPCPADPLGGLARRVGWVDSLRQAVDLPLLVVDAGKLLPARDAFPTLPEADWQRLQELHVEAAHRIGYDLVLSDPHSDPEGPHGDLPWIQPGEARLVRRGGLRIAIAAVDERSDPAPARRALTLLGPVDFVVLLCSGDLHFARRASRDLGASVCVVARGAAFREPVVEEGTLYLGPGRDGKYVGLAEVEVAAPHQVIPRALRLRRMDATAPAPAPWRERVEETVLAIERTSPGAFAAGE
jgi:hypothetical protein